MQTSRKPSVRRLTNRNAVGPTISKYIYQTECPVKHRYLKGLAIEIYSLPVFTANGIKFVFSFIKMSDRDLKCVYLFCQTDTFLFVIETPIRKFCYVNIL